MKRILTSHRMEKIRWSRRPTKRNPFSFPSFLSFMTRKPRAKELRRSIQWLYHYHYYFIKRRGYDSVFISLFRSLSIETKAYKFFIWVCVCASSKYKIDANRNSWYYLPAVSQSLIIVDLKIKKQKNHDFDICSRNSFACFFFTRSSILFFFTQLSINIFHIFTIIIYNIAQNFYPITNFSF